MIATEKMCVACRSLVFLDDHPGWGGPRLFCPVCGRDSITRLGPPPAVELRDYSEVEGAVLLLAQILGPDLAAEYVRRTAADDGEFFDPRGGDIVRALARAAVAKQVKAGNGHAPAAVGENGVGEFPLPATAGKRGRIQSVNGKRNGKGKVKGWAAAPKAKGPKAKGAPAGESVSAGAAVEPEPDLALTAVLGPAAPPAAVAVEEPAVPAWLTAAPGTEYFQGRQLALI